VFGSFPVTIAHGKGRTYEPTYDSSPTYDTAPIVTASPAEETAAQIQQMNDQNAMIQSMQAAQQQNDAAQAQFNADMAATIQTEINANQ
jgi:hypothetical protein